MDNIHLLIFNEKDKPKVRSYKFDGKVTHKDTVEGKVCIRFNFLTKKDAEWIKKNIKEYHLITKFEKFNIEDIL